jgi:hypothetical protein
MREKSKRRLWYGSGTALVRLENEKRPVFIGLERRYGSRGYEALITEFPVTGENTVEMESYKWN